MSDFVEECRREWKRLRVPDAVANEMAADLAADLAEAEAEGASPEQVLGSGAFDPRSFAASWAAERGVARPPEVTRRVLPVRPALPRLPAAIVVAAVIVTIVAALALVVRRRGSAQVVFPVKLGPLGPDPGGFPGPLESHRAFLLAGVGFFILLVGLVALVLWLVYRSPWAHLIRSRRSPFDEGVGGPG